MNSQLESTVHEASRYDFGWGLFTIRGLTLPLSPNLLPPRLKPAKLSTDDDNPVVVNSSYNNFTLINLHIYTKYLYKYILTDGLQMNKTYF